MTAAAAIPSDLLIPAVKHWMHSTSHRAYIRPGGTQIFICPAYHPSHLTECILLIVSQPGKFFLYYPLSHTDCILHT